MRIGDQVRQTRNHINFLTLLGYTNKYIQNASEMIGTIVKIQTIPVLNETNFQNDKISLTRIRTSRLMTINDDKKWGLWLAHESTLEVVDG